MRPIELTHEKRFSSLDKEWLVGEPARVVQQDNFKSDFDLDLYNPLGIDVDEIERHVKSFFGEKLMKPRSEDLWIEQDGTLDPNYTAMMQKSVNFWRERGDIRAATRFESELAGAKSIVKLVISSAENGDPLPMVVNASDPGDFYVDQEGNKKSVTFIWMLDSVEKGGWKYKVFSLPTKFIGLEKHWELLKEIGDLQKTKQILQESLVSLTSENLIAYPVLLNNLIHSIDEIARRLGYESWEEIERVAANQLALENDVNALGRRETMAQTFTQKIIEAVEELRPREYKEALVDAMSDMFALEAGSRDYLGLGPDEIRIEIEKTIRLSLAEKYRVFDNHSIGVGDNFNLKLEIGDLRELYVHKAWMINAFRTNPLAQEARATGCGGSGMSFSQGFGSDLFSNTYVNTSYAGMDMIQNFGYQGLMTGEMSYSESSSTGKYTEYYDYKPGTCTHCHEHKPYVAHPKSADIQCAGWCSDCET